MVDWKVLTKLKSGTIQINILKGTCFHNEKKISKLVMLKILDSWLREDLERNKIPLKIIREATLTIEFDTEEIPNQRDQSVSWADPRPPFIACNILCRSSINAGGKTFNSKMKDYEEWPKHLAK